MIRTTVAIAAGKLARQASRVRGGGSALPGLVAERIDPRFLRATLGDLPHGVIVVSGTNGKTTTTKMLAALLAEHGLRVFSNPTGSNFTRGVISSMLPRLGLRGRLAADIAVLELDEAHSLHFAQVLPPKHVLLLNVARDQLDRFAEIDHTARLLERLALTATDSVVLNADDGFVSRVASALSPERRVGWFSLAEQHADLLSTLHEAEVSVTDRSRHLPGRDDGVLTRVDERTLSIALGDRQVGPVQLQQHGLAAMINATAATTMAAQVLGAGFNPEAAAKALALVRPPFGRGEVIDAGGAPLELVLVKNPAGFGVALATYGGRPVDTMIAINDNYADGRDVSWLYDVDFSSLRGHGVAVTTGVRAWDMALRLQLDEVPVDAVTPDLAEALDDFLARHTGRPTRIFCTYTAMLTLRKMLGQRFDVPEMGEDSREESA